MQKARFTEEKMVLMLQAATRTSAADAGKKHGGSEQTLYKRRRRFDGISPLEVKLLLLR